MYETGGELCPVQSFQLYLRKLHPLQSRLFQQPRRKSTPASPMWYGKAPIGEKALQQMMANISGLCQLKYRILNMATARLVCIMCPEVYLYLNNIWLDLDQISHDVQIHHKPYFGFPGGQEEEEMKSYLGSL